MYDSQTYVILVGNPLEIQWWSIYGPFTWEHDAKEFSKHFTVPFVIKPILGMQEWIKDLDK